MTMKMTMKSSPTYLLLLLLHQTLLLLLLFATPASSQESTFYCDIPTDGCLNGMFNVELCECECIPPYCRWTDGTCTSPSGNCGGNPWEGCSRGVDCPWVCFCCIMCVCDYSLLFWGWSNAKVKKNVAETIEIYSFACHRNIFEYRRKQKECTPHRECPYIISQVCSVLFRSKRVNG